MEVVGKGVGVYRNFAFRVTFLMHETCLCFCSGNNDDDIALFFGFSLTMVRLLHQIFHILKCQNHARSCVFFTSFEQLGPGMKQDSFGKYFQFL